MCGKWFLHRVSGNCSTNYKTQAINDLRWRYAESTRLVQCWGVSKQSRSRRDAQTEFKSNILTTQSLSDPQAVQCSIVLHTKARFSGARMVSESAMNNCKIITWLRLLRASVLPNLGKIAICRRYATSFVPESTLSTSSLCKNHNKSWITLQHSSSLKTTGITKIVTIQ